MEAVLGIDLSMPTGGIGDGSRNGAPNREDTYGGLRLQPGQDAGHNRSSEDTPSNVADGDRHEPAAAPVGVCHPNYVERDSAIRTRRPRLAPHRRQGVGGEIEGKRQQHDDPRNDAEAAAARQPLSSPKNSAGPPTDLCISRNESGHDGKQTGRAGRNRT